MSDKITIVYLQSLSTSLSQVSAQETMPHPYRNPHVLLDPTQQKDRQFCCRHLMLTSCAELRILYEIQDDPTDSRRALVQRIKIKPVAQIPVWHVYFQHTAMAGFT